MGTVLLNVASHGQQGMHSCSRPQFTYIVSFDLATYPAGGYVGFSGLFSAIVGENMTLISAKQISACGGYKLWWDPVTDTLDCYVGAAGAGVDTEVAGGTDQAATLHCVMELTFV